MVIIAFLEKIFNKIVENYKINRKKRYDFVKLTSLSDRDLDDLGISRYDIYDLVYKDKKRN